MFAYTYICWWISSISRSENQPFFVIVLTWSASLWFVALNLPNSVQISIILFLYSLFARLLLRWQYNASLLSSLVYFLRCGVWCVHRLCTRKKNFFLYLEKEQPTFPGCLWGPRYWLSREHLPIMTPKPVLWVPYFDLSFFMNSILWLYQSQELFIICAPDTDVTENSHSDCLWTPGYTHNK